MPSSPSPHHPQDDLPQDALQRLLAPLQGMSLEQAEALDPDGRNPDLLLTEQLLSFNHLGLPLWWPLEGHNGQGPRRALLAAIRETLPEDFQPTDASPSNMRLLVSTLRRIASELTS